MCAWHGRGLCYSWPPAQPDPSVSVSYDQADAPLERGRPALRLRSAGSATMIVYRGLAPTGPPRACRGLAVIYPRVTISRLTPHSFVSAQREAPRRRLVPRWEHAA